MSIRKHAGRAVVVAVALLCIAWFAIAAWVGMSKSAEWYGPNGVGGVVDMPVPPCITEDSPGPCYWDAEVRSNGMGRSFTVDATGHVTYWDEAVEG